MERIFSFLRPSRRDLPTLSTRAGYLGRKMATVPSTSQQSSPVIVPEVRMLPVEAATPDLTGIALDPIFDGNVIEPVMKTPAKDQMRKRKMTPISTPPSSVSTKNSTSSNGSPAKKMLLPSPGKRYLQAQASQENEVSELESIEEEAEMVAFGTPIHEPVEVC